MGWKPLFNGKDLSEWVIQGRPEDISKQFFSVKDSAIVINTNGDRKHDYTWLTTKKEFKNADIKLKFALFRSSKGNSGIQVLSHYDKDSLCMDGPQVDISPSEPFRNGLMWDETRGVKRWIFPNLPKGKWINESMVIGKPQIYYSDEVLTWNNMEIKVEGLIVKAWINGVLVTDFNGAGIIDDDIHRKRLTGQKGVISIQVHSRDDLKIMFRDIYIKKI